MQSISSQPDPQATPTSSSKGLQRCHLLYLEDHNDTARIMARAISRFLDLRVTVCPTLEEAVLTALSDHSIDIILADLRLPDGSGLDLLKRIREMGGEVTVPAISFSTLARKQDYDASIQAGFVEHVVKPASIHELTNILLRHLPEHCDEEGDEKRAKARAVATGSA